MVGTRGGYEFEAEDHDDQALERAGRALLGGVKGKDQALRLLKVGGGPAGAAARPGDDVHPFCNRSPRPPCPQGAGESLAEAAQSSESARRSSRELAKGLVRPDVLRHKDKVRGGALQPAPPPPALDRNSAAPGPLAPTCSRPLPCRRCACMRRSACATSCASTRPTRPTQTRSWRCEAAWQPPHAPPLPAPARFLAANGRFRHVACCSVLTLPAAAMACRAFSSC